MTFSLVRRCGCNPVLRSLCGTSVVVIIQRDWRHSCTSESKTKYLAYSILTAKARVPPYGHGQESSFVKTSTSLDADAPHQAAHKYEPSITHCMKLAVQA